MLIRKSEQKTREISDKMRQLRRSLVVSSGLCNSPRFISRLPSTYWNLMYGRRSEAVLDKKNRKTSNRPCSRPSKHKKAGTKDGEVQIQR